MSRQVKVFRSSRQPEMYLFVDAAEEFTRVPDPLLARFGRPVLALTLELTPERVLARIDASTVLAQIEATGFYLQMPPRVEEGGGA